MSPINLDCKNILKSKNVKIVGKTQRSPNLARNPGVALGGCKQWELTETLSKQTCCMINILRRKRSHFITEVHGLIFWRELIIEENFASATEGVLFGGRALFPHFTVSCCGRESISVCYDAHTCQIFFTRFAPLLKHGNISGQHFYLVFKNLPHSI